MTNPYSEIRETLSRGYPVACNTTITQSGLTKSVSLVREVGRTASIEQTDEIRLQEIYVPEPRLIVFGGGHVGHSLASLASDCGFDVTVVDDRPDIACPERYPHVSVLCGPFEDSFQSLNLTPQCYLVIVTRGHQHDLTCLRQALTHQAAYIGMMGSSNKVNVILDRLRDEGISQETLSRVSAPIGLRIGATTPEEIAVSILAQLIVFRRLDITHEAPGFGGGRHVPHFDRQVLRNLDSDDWTLRAVATIVRSTGSTPREPGAKMVVWPDRTSLGTVGGGALENTAINEASRVARDGGHALMTISLSESTSESQMGCGGSVEVLVESWPYRPAVTAVSAVPVMPAVHSGTNRVATCG